jgi:hypothetical protein
MSKPKRQGIQEDGVWKIPLTRGSYALVDEQDVAYLTQWNWHGVNHYAQRGTTLNGVRAAHRMHNVVYERFIGAIPSGLLVDHKNGNSLDNRRSNLRLATTAQNLRNINRIRKHNTSGVTGVRFLSDGRLEAYLGYQGDTHSQIFTDIQEAVDWRNELGYRLHGEFYVPSVVPPDFQRPEPVTSENTRQIEALELENRQLVNALLRQRLVQLPQHKD